MLVYSSNFTFEPEGGPQDIINCVARWMGTRSRSYVDPLRLGEGIRDLTLAGGMHVHSRVTRDEDLKPTYPFFFSAQLTHGDEQVSGRRWTTEIGLYQEMSAAPIDCSFLLKTDEVSARVNAPIQVTRPRLVKDLTDSCRPSGTTPGTRVKRLDEESAAAFLVEVEHDHRSSPIVVVSCTRDGEYMVSPERMQSLLVGIADVVEVPRGADTFRIEETLGRQYGAWGGAINIVFQPRRGRTGMFCETVRYRPNDLLELQEEGKNLDSEILATVTHRTNLPYSWRHISPEVVGRAILRRQLTRTIHRAKLNDESGEYVALLEAADKELLDKEEEVVELRSDIEERDGEIRKLQSDIDGLKHALSGRQSTTTETSEEDLRAMAPLREAVSALIDGEPRLEHSLTLISTFFPDRVVVLESAFNSARDSKGFRYGKKGFDLLWNLTNGYWSALKKGQGDSQAKQVFGQSGYAQNESQALSNEGKRRRTFLYRSQEILMEKHLKIGVKDSVAETLRVHFEWMGNDNRIVIGHCGKHLDF